MPWRRRLRGALRRLRLWRFILRAHGRNPRRAAAYAISVGCILSNELLDALPVHLVKMERGALREALVTVRDDVLTEEFAAPTTPELEAYFQEQGIVLQEEQLAEVGLDVCRWIEDAGRKLGRGFVLTIDYGASEELYNERHMRGTLLAYANHQVSEDFLRAPGDQDLTAHVNFTTLDIWGRRGGLTRTGSVTQMAFLIAMGRGNEFADLYEPGANEVERVKARLMLKTLIHAEGMGETFQVFVQHKGFAESGETPKLTGLGGSSGLRFRSCGAASGFTIFSLRAGLGSWSRDVVPGSRNRGSEIALGFGLRAASVVIGLLRFAVLVHGAGAVPGNVVNFPQIDVRPDFHPFGAGVHLAIERVAKRIGRCGVIFLVEKRLAGAEFRERIILIDGQGLRVLLQGVVVAALFRLNASPRAMVARMRSWALDFST